MSTKILVATDGGAPATRAVAVAVDLARRLGAQLGLVHVVDESRAFVPDLAVLDEVIMAELRRKGLAALDRACTSIRSTMKVERFLVDGDPGDAIIATARRWGADLIVIGSDSRGRLAHFLLGSTADAVIRKAPCPVVSVRALAAPAEINEQAMGVATAP